MKKLLLSSVLLLLQQMMYSQTEQRIEKGNNQPQTLILDGHSLATNKKLIAENEAVKKTAFIHLLKAADKIIKQGILYSVMDKKIIPPGGDKHDYMSQAPYWWADTAKANGLPYIRRDGETNPEYYNITDSKEMDEMESDIETVALAWYFSGEERYANWAARLIQTWFLDDATRQNPNLNFGQGIPGINTGRGIGLIETRELYRVIDGAILLQGSKSWTKDNHGTLKKWFANFLTWQTESQLGKEEAAAENNHGTYYDVQVIVNAIFADKKDIAIKQFELSKKRMTSQLKEDGSQPRELERTKSWDYVNMNLLGFCFLARLGENVNINLWKFETPDGKNIRQCIDWLVPYLKKEKKWTTQQIKEIKYGQSLKILKMAAKAYSNPAYDELAKQVDGTLYQSEYYQLVF